MLVKTLKMLHNINIEVYCTLLVQHVYTLIQSWCSSFRPPCKSRVGAPHMWLWISVLKFVSIRAFSPCFTP